MAPKPSCDVLCKGGVLCRSAGGRGTPTGRTLHKAARRQARELRFHLDDFAVRITYWIAPHRRIVLLTVFHKTRLREDREVERARRAMRRCVEMAHTIDEEEEAR
ncbi:type II toxin-antitoxin system RelE/ParE family toxin [Nonomuraea recticatena]|uniref:type II toxin-antitoxin system RelE/ParE family toxin n=1 Tax=Nonomuraea recticatena TaxID=46178 RepID=UPI0031F76C86